MLGLEGYSQVVSEVRAAGMDIPITAIGGITLEDIPAIMSTGVNGVAMSSAIINAPDPVEYTARVIETLTSR